MLQIEESLCEIQACLDYEKYSIFHTTLLVVLDLTKVYFSSSVIFTAPGLRSSGRLGLIEKMAGAQFDANEETMITAIPKDKAEDLMEVIRNGMDKYREVYPHPNQI